MNDDELKGAEVDVDAARHPAPDDFDPTLTFGSSAIPREGGAGSAEIGPYRLVRRIGRGGMGEVWLAEQSTPVQRRVALKLIKAGMDTHEFVARFESERQALARMEHPAIARVFEAGSTVENHPYFAMEYVDGVSITAYCDAHKWTLRERLQLFTQVCEGVQHAHQKAILHRDLKPSNILVTEIDGRPAPKIIDFGLAKAMSDPLYCETVITRMGTIVGTPDYMSPEQADYEEQDIDTRTDVYSLGVILFELLVGTLPVKLSGLPIGEMFRKLREQDSPRPSTKVSTQGPAAAANAENRQTDSKTLVRQLRGDLDAIVLKATEKDRARRYGTAAELAADILHYLRYEPVSAHAPALAYRTGKYVRRHRVGVSAAGAVVALLVVSAIAQNIQLRRVIRERDRADRITSFMTQMFNVAGPRQARGRTVTAREVLDKASQDIEKTLGSDPELKAQMMDIMGRVYNQIGVYPRAEQLLRDSAAIRRRVLGAQAPETLTSVSDLGGVLYGEGRYRESENLLSAVVEAQRRILGPNHAETLFSMMRLAAPLVQEHKFAEAEKLQREAIAAAVATFGPKSITTVGMENDLAGTLRSEARYPEAEKLQREVLDVQRRVLGQNDPQTMKSMMNLANNFIDEGRYVEAEKLQREALELYNRVLGPENSFTLELMNALAVSLLEERKYVEAEALERKVLETQKRVIGPRHPHIAGTLYNLGCIVEGTGKPEEAFSLVRQAIDIAPLDIASALAQETDNGAGSLRKNPRYAELIAYARERAKSASTK